MSPVISILLAFCLLTLRVASAASTTPPVPNNTPPPDTTTSDGTGFLPDSATSTMNTPTDILPDITTTTITTTEAPTTTPTITQPPTITPIITQPTTTPIITTPITITTATTTTTTPTAPTTTAATTTTEATTTTTEATTITTTTNPTTTTKHSNPNGNLNREVMLILMALSDDEGEDLNLMMMRELYFQHKPTSSGLPPSSLWNPRMRKYYLADQLAARLGGWSASGSLVSTVLRNLDDDGLSPALLYAIKVAADKANGSNSFNFSGWMSPWLWRMMND